MDIKNYIDFLTNNKTERECVDLVLDRVIKEGFTEFDSKKKYSEVITEDYTYRLGAPEYLLTEKQLREVHIKLDIKKDK